MYRPWYRQRSVAREGNRGRYRKGEKERERDREIEHFSGARPRREYEWLIARAAASGRELRAFVCPPLAETREVSRT